MQKISRAQKRFRGMLWSFVLILGLAMLLPTAYVVLQSGDAQAQVVNDTNQRANFWRAVREGQAGYSSVGNPEAGVFINNGGQNWRQFRDDVLLKYGGWGVLGALGLVFLFYIIRGKIAVTEPKTGLLVPRWNKAERFMHWYTAILFCVLAITGLSMLFGRTVLIPLVGANVFAGFAGLAIQVHNIVGPFFSIGVLAMLVFWIKNNIPSGVDLKWLISGGGIIGNAHPSAGKANGGEKIWYWIVILLGLGAVCGTGLALIGWLNIIGIGDVTRATMQEMHVIHAVAAVIWIMIFFGHAYIGTVGTEGAYEGMRTGSVTAEWAKQHHDLWYEEVKDQAVRDHTVKIEQESAPDQPVTSPSAN